MWLPPAFDSLAPQGFCLTPNLQLFANFFVTHHGCPHTILDHSSPRALLSRCQSSSAYGDAPADFILVSCTEKFFLTDTGWVANSNGTGGSKSTVILFRLFV
jgi:hypothetical protein